MTQPPPQVQASTPAADSATNEQPPFPPAPVEELLHLLVKAVRAQQLYMPNNPVYRTAIDSVRAAFASLWQHTEDVALRFTETEARWYGHPVMVESAKSPDSLPWTFFKDGIREIQLSRGFEDEELVRFLEILQRVRKASPEDDDLLTLLWEADFANLRYRYVDVGTEQVAPLESGEATEPASPDDLRSAAQGTAESERPNVVNMQDFDATLYFLDDKELDYLRTEIEREYSSDLRRNVVASLLDIYESQTTPVIREEVVDHLESIILLLLASGQLRTVAYLLSETRVVAQRAPLMTDEQRERMSMMPHRLSAAEPLGQLLHALDESAMLPPPDELAALFEQLQPSALGTIFAMLPRLQNQEVRKLVESAAERLARANTAELVKLVLSPNEVVAAEAIRRAGAMKTAAAVAGIARVLRDGSVSLRLAAVQSLTDIGSAGALQVLEASVTDPDRDVRIGAVRTLAAKAHRGAFSRLEPIVKGKAIRQADITEKMAFFEAFGAMCGDSGIAFLDGLLNGKGLFGKREDADTRACAAIALGRIGSRKALESLERSAGEKDVVVRSAIQRAMRPAGGT